MSIYTLRYKSNKNSITPYLDRVDPQNKSKRDRIILREYKFPITPKTKEEKALKKQMELYATTYCSDLNKKVMDKSIGLKTYDLQASFIEYLESKYSEITHSNRENTKLNAIIKVIKSYSKNKDVLFEDVITYKWLNDFKTFLLHGYKTKSGNNLGTNTASAYLRKAKLFIGEAYREGLINTHALEEVTPIKEIETDKECLSLEELKLLIADPSSKLIPVKKAFIFCCFTGLRHGDAMALKWSDIKEENGLKYTTIRQQKTKRFVKIYIDDHPLELIGYDKENTGLVFEGLKVADSPKISGWITSHKIKKHLTFHTSRHVNASILLANGADIYTVCKVLGHKNITTTEIYLHLVDENLKKASKIISNLVK